MKFTETPLKGAYVIELEPVEDNRGAFMRTFCKEAFKGHGLIFNVVQSSISYNKSRGVLRGMHYQVLPYEEEKVVLCVKGAIYDVIVDLRVDSPTRHQWFSAELSEKNGCALYIPKGFAHGFQTLVDDAVVSYSMSEYYHPECARTLAWNDPRLSIAWPLRESAILSAKDAHGVATI